MRDVRGNAGLESGSGARTSAASYEEFVATRGPALFRTAYLLAGDRAGAAELVQVALVRLHLAWRRARHAESAELFATGLLVATFTRQRQPARLVEEPLVRVSDEQQPDPDPAERMLVWPHLAVLEPRERAVVVLGSTQALGDQQIAEQVGVSRRSVATAGRAALTALAAATGRSARDVRDRLGPELREIAESRPVPELAVEALARLGAAESVRRRKRLLAATAAAVAVVVAVGFVPGLVAGGSSRPPRSPSLPGAADQLTPGPETTLPWWSGGELHVDGRVVPTNHDQIVSAGGTTLVGDVYVGGFEHLSSWWTVTPRGLVPLVSSTTSVFTPVLSPDGRHVAWAEPHGRNRWRVVLRDLRDAQAGGRLPVRLPPACCGRASELVIRGVDTRGQVFFDTGGLLRVWRVGARPHVVRGMSGGLYQVNAYPGGIAWQAQAADPLGPFPISYGWVGDRGRVHQEGSLPNGSLWSPDGGWFAFVGEHRRSGLVRPIPDEVWAADALHSRLRQMRLPDHASYQLVGWESPTSVVVAVRRDTGRPLRGSDLPDEVQLLRCHPASGACETAGLAPQTILGLSPYY